MRFTVISRPATSESTSIASESETVEPPPMLNVPPTPGVVAAASVAATTSLTKVKSRVCSPSPKTTDRLSVSAACRSAERHVGPLPWAIHREVAERDRIDAPVGAVEMAEVLGGELRDPVRGERRGDIVFVGGQLLGVPVDRRRRTRTRNSRRMRLGRLEQMLGSQHVVVQVGIEARAPARAHPRLGGEVEDHVAVGDEPLELPARQIYRDEVEGVPAPSLLEVLQLLRPSVVGVEAVDADDLVAVSSSDSVRCEPTNPAQPVTSARISVILTNVRGTTSGIVGTLGPAVPFKAFRSPRGTRLWGGLVPPRWLVGITIVGSLIAVSGAGAAALLDGRDIRDGSLTGKDIRNGSLTKRDFRGTLADTRVTPVPQGAPGPRGPAGADGTPGPEGDPGTPDVHAPGGNDGAAECRHLDVRRQAPSGRWPAKHPGGGGTEPWRGDFRNPVWRWTHEPIHSL